MTAESAKKIMRLKTLVIGAGAALVVLCACSVWALYTYYHAVDIGERSVSIIISQGDGFDSVVDRLVSQGVVNSRAALKYPAILKGLDKKLIPGRYDFQGENSCQSILARLEKGDFLRIKVTVPEGAEIWKVASILAVRLQTDSAEAIALNHDSAFLAKLNLPYLEGYLFPETYFFPWGTSLREAIKQMTEQAITLTDSLWPDLITNSLTRQQAVILASIIESETSMGSERNRVASVYHNRLARRMKLDADPTVIYGLGGLDRPLWRRDLRRETPYNTYLHKGLPPTPINSPGLEAIKAALNPETTDYLYFVADGSGGHRFSRTNAEHNRAVREIRAQSKD
jgi:UPF0755 protein